MLVEWGGRHSCERDQELSRSFQWARWAQGRDSARAIDESLEFREEARVGRKGRGLVSDMWKLKCWQGIQTKM